MSKTDQNFIFVFKKTNELKADEIKQLIKLHNETMNKERTETEFKEKYLYNFLESKEILNFIMLINLEQIV